MSQKHEKEFPVLSFLVKFILCCPGSTIASECEFSNSSYHVWQEELGFLKKFRKNYILYKIDDHYYILCP